MKRIAYYFLFFLFIILPASLSAVERVDGIGRRVDIPENPQRVIAFAPNLTEIVFAVNRGGLLIGATKYGTHPAEAQELPRVGTYVQLDIEKIVSLQPDLCIASKDGNPPQTVERLAEMGIPTYVVDPQNLEGIKETVLSIGGILNAEKEAAAIAHDMEIRMARVNDLVSGLVNRPKVFFQIDDAPMVSVGSGTFIDELIHLAGGTNIASGSIPYPRYGWEGLLESQPEVVIITSMAGGQSEEQLRNQWLKWPQIKAVADGRVYVVDANLFDRATPRLVEGLEVLVTLISGKNIVQKGKSNEQ
jgi:iron complex transport system substrate-binding protein